MLKIALSKGILYDSSVDLLRKSGIKIEELEKSGRRLLISSADNITYILARPADVPTYVEYGAADIGFAGKDALMENETDVFELLDLEIGKCRFVLAQPKAGLQKTGRDYQKLGQLRVATKYPVVAANYLSKKGIQAEIITLRGSIELAPLTGLADMIIDLTTTGKTLAENELIELDEIAKCSARLVANSVSTRLKYEEIQDFMKRLKV
ncbi:MAG: ATP phosphoribosyltransferase [Actinobacteria bacterium]|nr:MAG: ATP phosphoribosyltransferase [Actinomycetota bacterium]